MSKHAVTPLSRRLAAVAMTYTTRPLFYWVAGLGFVVTIFVSNLFWMTMAPIVAGVLLSLHARFQFVTPSARLIPDYRTPHLVANGILAAVFFVIAPLICAHIAKASPIGTIALAVCLGSLAVWATHYRWLWLLLYGVIFSFLQSPVEGFWLNPGVPYLPIQMTLFAAGGSGFALWLRRLAILHEERDDYVIPPFVAAVRRPSRNERAEQRKTAARQLNRQQQVSSWLVDWRIDAALSNGVLSKAQLVRLGIGPHAALVKAVGECALFGALCVIMREWMKLPAIAVLFIILILSGFRPAVEIAKRLEAKRSQLEADLMRPLHRDAYFAALIGGYLRDLAVAVMAFCILAWLVVLYYQPERANAATILTFCVQMAATNLLCFAAHLHLASWWGAMSRITVLLVPTYVLIALNVWLWLSIDDHGVGPILACSAVYAALAALTLRAAHRRWMNVEVG